MSSEWSLLLCRSKQMASFLQSHVVDPLQAFPDAVMGCLETNELFWMQMFCKRKWVVLDANGHFQNEQMIELWLVL